MTNSKPMTETPGGAVETETDSRRFERHHALRSRTRRGLVVRLLALAPSVAVAAMACETSPRPPPLGEVTRSTTAVALGTAQSFAVLAGSAVTNTGSTVVMGDLGVAPGGAVTGFPPGLVNGTIHADDAVALQAQNDATTAYDALAGQACDQSLTGQDLGGLTLTPGTYCFSSSAQLTGILTLNAEGDPAAEFVFQIGSTLTTATSSAVRMINGGNFCNVYWQVGSSATLGTDTSFMGSIIALTSITLTTGASVSGRTLARNAAVTLDTNSVSAAGCQDEPDGGGNGTGTGGTSGDAGVDGAAGAAPVGSGGSGAAGSSAGGAVGSGGSGTAGSGTGGAPGYGGSGAAGSATGGAEGSGGSGAAGSDAGGATGAGGCHHSGVGGVAGTDDSGSGCNAPCGSCNAAGGSCNAAGGSCNAPCGDCNAPCGDCNTPCGDCNTPCGDCNAPCGDCNAPCGDSPCG